MNPLVIVQARMGSKRFPGKVLAPLRGAPLIEHVVRSCTEAEMRTIVAMPMSKGNVPLRTFLDHINVEWDEAADENDVLGRFAAVARKQPQHDVIVRVTADCPLIDHRTIIELVDKRDTLGLFYIGRCNDPDGNDVEVFTRDALMEAHATCEPHQREHVTTWIREQGHAIQSPTGVDHSGVKYSVDTVDDLRLCEQLLNACGEGATWQRYSAAARRLRVPA